MPGDLAERSRKAALAAGLRYVTDYSPGIRRKRAGRGFCYIDPQGRRISDPRKIRRFRSLAIPPAWTDVWICPSPNGHIQVTARDTKGRKQYRYHPKYREIRDGTKFDRMLEFSEALPQLRETVEQDLLLRGLPRRKVLATCVRLLETTLIRVGKPQYTRSNKSFGLTTLQDRHVDVRGSTIHFEFRGKSGIQRSVTLSDRRIARIVQSCRMLHGEKLFQYCTGSGDRHRVHAEDINGYMRAVTGRDITAKDFRTWAGTMFAAAALRDIGPAEKITRAKKNIVQAIDHVAARLGNTRAVCRKYYVHPAILDAYLRGRVLPPAPKRIRPKNRSPRGALRREEVIVLQFLHEELDGRPERREKPPDR